MSRSIYFSLLCMLMGQSTPLATTEFDCTDDICRCVTGDCVHTCASQQQCANTYFVCSADANSCLIHCDGDASCKAAHVFGSADSINVNCNGAHSCDELQVYCGASSNAVIPPALSVDSQSQSTASIITDCFVNVLSSDAMRGGHMQCDGAVANCVMNAYAHNAINDTLFNCTIETPPVSTSVHGCQLNCIPSSNCDAIEFVCASEQCSCGVNDPACTSSSIHFSTQSPTPAPTPPVGYAQEPYNCLDLEHTELEIKSIVDSDRQSMFEYEIGGKDADDQSITFRYQQPNGVLSADAFTLYQSEPYTFGESDGETYRFEWTHTEPKHLCWRTDELNAIKIDLYYNRNVSFAFTLIYHENEVARTAAADNDRHGLVPKNNYNLAHPVSYLYFGFIYFRYESDVLLHAPVVPTTSTPTSAPTVRPTLPPLQISHVNSTVPDGPDNQGNENENNGNDNGDQGDRVVATPRPTSSSTTPPGDNEQQVQEHSSTTLSVQPENANKNESVSAQNHGVDNDTLKHILFAVAGVLFAAMVCCIVFLVLRTRRKHNQEGMQGAYATADDVDTDPDDDEEYGGGDNDFHLDGNGKGNGVHLNFNKLRFNNRKGHASEADIDEADDAEMGRNGIGGGTHHLLSDDGNIQGASVGGGGGNEVEDQNEYRRRGSGIIDEADLMDQNEYDQLKRDANMNAADKRQSESQTSQTSQNMRKFRKLNPQQIMASRVGVAGGAQRAQTAAAVGVGFVAPTQRLRSGGGSELDDDDDTESLMFRERDVSMDAEYHHIIADPDPKTAMSVLDDDDEEDNNADEQHDRRESLSLTENEISARRDVPDFPPPQQQAANMYDTMLIHKSISSMDDHMRDDILQQSPPPPNQEDAALQMKTTQHMHKSKVPSSSVTVTRHKNDHRSNRSNTTLGFEPGSVLDHYVNQDSTFQTLQRLNNHSLGESPQSERTASPKEKKERAPKKEKERRHSISRSMSQSMSIPPITFNQDVVNVKTLKTKTSVQTAAVSMKMFSKKIQDCAAKFGHGNALTTTKKKTNSNELAVDVPAAAVSAVQPNPNERNPKPKQPKESAQTPSTMKPSQRNGMDANDRDVRRVGNRNDEDYATMVIYKNVEQTSLIPALQANKRKPAAASKNVPFDGVNTQFLEPSSTQTMIVKRDAPGNIDAQLTNLHQKASRGPLVSEDTSTEDEEEDSARDPIDASEEEDAGHQKRHRHNRSSASNRSSHQRTMIINDDLDIDHIMHSIEDDD